ncbi:MAG: DinB family protein [Planctomycetota bacterium]
MHAQTTELLAHLDDGRTDLLAVVDAVPESDRARAPAAGRWSLANLLSHLARTEGQIGAFLQRRLRQALSDGDLPELPPGAASAVASFDAATVLDRSQRIEAPDFAAPDLAMPFAEARSQLDRARQRLQQVVLAADGKDVAAIRERHFVFGELTFYQWVAFAGFHERRHTEQAREVVEALRK